MVASEKKRFAEAEFDQMHAYTGAVCGHIHWKLARQAVAQELSDHILDQREAYLAAGMEPAQAMQQAVAQMGDPVPVGQALNKTHRPQPQWMMILLMVSLLLAGLAVHFLLGGNLRSVVAWATVGLVVFLVCYYADFSALGRYPGRCFLAVCLLSLFGMVLGDEINGTFYLFLGPLSVDLSNLVLLYPVVFALVIYSQRYCGWAGLFRCGMGYLVLVYLSGVLGSSAGVLLFTVASLVLLQLSLCRGWFAVKSSVARWLPSLAVSMVLISTLLLFLNHPSRIRRLQVLFDPFSDPAGRGYIPCLIRGQLSQAQFWGAGQGQPWPDHLSMDFLLTKVIAQLGWGIFFLLLLVFAIFIGKALVLCARQHSMLGGLLSMAVLLTFSGELLLYLMNNLGLNLTTTAWLPFFPLGNTASMLNMMLIGLMLSVYRCGTAMVDPR